MDTIAGWDAAQSEHPVDRTAVAAVVLGNALEFYDFITYSFFAKEIGDAFFPAGGATASLLSSLLVFWVGFFTRPIGAVVLGAYADKGGRKPAMLVTIALMAAGMLILAITPGFATIGWAAPVVVVLGRLIQGFALGGEVGPTTAYLVETAAAGRRGLMASWQLASQGFAQLFAGALGVALSFALPPEAMHAWGWRVPFVVGVLIVPVGLIIRNHLPETAEVDETPASSREVLARLSRGHARVLVAGFLLIMGSTIATYAGINMPTYAKATLGLSLKISSVVTVALGVASIVFSLVGGWLADRLRAPADDVVPARGHRARRRAGLSLDGPGAVRGKRRHGDGRWRGADLPRQRRHDRWNSRGAAAHRTQRRLVDRLRARRHAVRRLDTMGAEQADRGDGRQAGARLLPGGDRDHRRSCRADAAGDAREAARLRRSGLPEATVAQEVERGANRRGVTHDERVGCRHDDQVGHAGQPRAGERDLAVVRLRQEEPAEGVESTCAGDDADVAVEDQG